MTLFSKAVHQTPVHASMTRHHEQPRGFAVADTELLQAALVHLGLGRVLQNLQCINVAGMSSLRQVFLQFGIGCHGPGWDKLCKEGAGVQCIHMLTFVIV